MAQFPAFPLWTDAYLADTKHLTTLEHGAYALLLMALWRADGWLPNDDRKISRIAGLGPNQWTRIKPTIMEFMTLSDDGLHFTQGRLSDELAYVREHSKKQADNARIRWRNKPALPIAVEQHPDPLLNGASANPLRNNAAPDAMGMPNACQTDAPTPTPLEERNQPDGWLSETEVSDPPKPSRKRNEYAADFAAAWGSYPTDPNMSKAKAYTAWCKLGAEDRQKLASAIPGFVAYCRKDATYRPVHMVRFITERRFDGFLDAAAPRPTSADDWNKRLTFARSQLTWSTPQWGPKPGLPGRLVPPALLVPGDGALWTEHELRVA